MESSLKKGGKKKKDMGDGEIFSPPKITRDLTSRQVRLGSKVVLRISATGVPLPSFQWLLNGKKISGAVMDRYVIPKMRRNHMGAYSCEVKNYAGSVMSREAVISFLAEKVIKIEIEPAIASVNAGQSFVFRIASPSKEDANGLVFQWLYNGRRISGATGMTLSFTEMKAKYAGEYKVILVTGSEIISSNIVKLTVNEGQKSAVAPEALAPAPPPPRAPAPTYEAEDYFFDPSEEDDLVLDNSEEKAA